MREFSHESGTGEESMNQFGIETWEELSFRLMSLPRKQGTMLVAIDGPGGSGKSTVARLIAKHSENTSVLSMDDFFFPSEMRGSATGDVSEVGGDQDWRRVLDQVLTPLARDQYCSYQRYDWASDKLQEWHNIAVGGVVIVEGVYSLRRELREIYDYKIWIDCPKDVYLARGLARSEIEWPDRPLEESLALWEEQYIPAEERYAREHNSRNVADLIIDTSGRIEVDVQTQYVRRMSIQSSS
jgi:uridine kinase